MTEDNNYYFGFRQTIPPPPGSWVIKGPYKTYDKALSVRENAKEYDAQVTVPFVASSEKEANERVHLF